MSRTVSRWAVTADKFLSPDQISYLIHFLRARRDLAIARSNDTQAIRDYYALRTLLESGIRVFEFCALVNSDVHGQKLIVKRGKGGKSRTILLTKTTGNLLKEWLNVKAKIGHSLDPFAPLFPSRYGTAYTTRGVQKRVKIIFAALKFAPHLSIHSLRHTYCSLLLASGKVSLATAKENLGHHSIAVTNLYAHAMGNLDDVELYAQPSSQKTDLSELQQTQQLKKANSSVKAFLRNMNFNH